MKSKLGIILVNTILLLSQFAFAQKAGNGGIICNDDIKSALMQLARETPKTSSFEMQGHSSLGPVFEGIARGEINNSSDSNSVMFDLTAKTTDQNQVVYVLTYNSLACAYKNQQLNSGSNALKEMLRVFVQNKFISVNGGIRSAR